MISELNARLDSLEELLNPQLEQSLEENLKKMGSKWDQASHLVLVGFALTSLQHAHSKVTGSSVHKKIVKKELGRLRTYFDKINSTRVLGVDQSAAKRFVKAGLASVKPGSHTKFD